MAPENDSNETYDTPDKSNDDFLLTLRKKLQSVEGEIAERNDHIDDRDQYIYSDKLERMIDIPIGHDFTPVNWLKRTVEIHKTQFMGRPFMVNSTYNLDDISTATDDQDKSRKELANQKQKAMAEMRSKLVADIIRDNGGHGIFADGAESASATGNWVVKGYWDEKNQKYVLSPVEAVENCYAVWSRDNFREMDVFAFAYQISKQKAASEYGLDEDELTTSPLGNPFVIDNPAGVQIGSNNSSLNVATAGQTTGEPMVTVLEATGKVDGWGVKNGKLVEVPLGQEDIVNCVYVGNKLVRLIYDKNKLPKYYVFPNKKIRRRAWGVSDITDAAINLNVTYIETFSDWRTVAAKVNFPKYKGFNFGPDTQMPKFRERKIELLPLGDGQDMTLLQTGDSGALDWGRQLDEIKEQFVRETGISRVLFDDPSVTLNSNQALLTSMKPTSDIAENKKQLWGPILVQMFTDAINSVAANKEEYKELADGDWWLKIQWPSVMQKEDPVFQQMLLNRKNAGTMSLETYLEMQGETKEEIDRLRDEMEDPITAAVLGNGLSELAHMTLNKALGIPPWGYVTPKVQLRGDLSPQEVGNMAHNYQWDQGPYGPAIGPQGYEGMAANDNFINSGMITDTKQGPQANYQGPQPQVATPGQNTPGSQPMSQPGSGATPVSPQGALNQVNQQQGK